MIVLRNEEVVDLTEWLQKICQISGAKITIGMERNRRAMSNFVAP